MRIDRDRLLQQAQSLQSALFRCGKVGCKRAQIEIIGGEISRWPHSRTGGFGGLQCRFDHTGDANRDLVLEIENVLKRTIEAVGPEMRVGFGLDQLRGNPHPTACLAD